MPNGEELARPLLAASSPLDAGLPEAAAHPRLTPELSVRLAQEQAHEEPCMISNADDFDTKQSGLHQLQQALHGAQSYNEWMDEFMAFCMVMLTYAFMAFSMLHWSWVFLRGAIEGNPPSAITLARFSGDVILGVSLFAIVLLWTTICYKSTPVHTFWKGQYTRMFTKTLMPGGFAPRPTALSLGTLMFVTSTLIKEDLKKGSQLDEHTIGGYEGCRAVEMESIHADQMWLSRLYRHGPANMGYTCFNVNQTDALGYVFSSVAFTWQDYQNTSVLIHPKRQAVDESTTSWVSRLRSTIVSFFSGHFVNRSQFDDTSQWECKYQCIKWQSVGIKSLLSSVSILLVGCATITKFTDLLSSNFGGKLLKGQFVTDDTSSEDMFLILQRTLKMNCIPKSRALCFGILILALAVPLYMIAPKICLDGYYSVDYWVSGVFISSLVIALILRRWNPYLNAPMVYTRRLWEEGEDTFVMMDPPHDTEYVKIDLYQWFHLSARQRNSHLFKYARRVGAEDIDAEIKRQKKVRDRCLSVKGKERIPEIDGVYAWQKPEKSNHWRQKFSREEKVGNYEHAMLEGTRFEYIDGEHMWKLTTTSSNGSTKVYWSKPTEHGNRPPTGPWTFEDGTGKVDLTVTPSGGAKSQLTKKDIDGAAGLLVESRFVHQKAIVPKHFRLKNGAVHYDPALDDEGAPLLVMCLNTFETVEWVDGVKDDEDPDADLPTAPESRFVVRKVRTTIPKGTVGVVVAKKSKDDAVINWSAGSRRFFPPLKGKHPDDAFENRIKVTVKLSNLMEVGESWRTAREKIDRLQKEQHGRLAVEDLTMQLMDEPSKEARRPLCFRDAAIVAELATLNKA